MSTHAPRIPRATYRLQFHAGFRLADATARLPHLAALGVSDLYASPLLRARPGSTHGYDVIDPERLNPELGSDADLDALVAALHARGMRLLLDIVPNHMGVLEADNPWWLEVLEHGPAALHARAFDIDWQPPQRELHGKLLLAVLGGAYGDILEAGELRPVFDAQRGQFVIRYFDHRFPIDPADYAALLRAVPLPAGLQAVKAKRVLPLIEGFAALAARDIEGEFGRARRRREAAALKASLAQAHREVPGFAAWLEACAQALAGRVGEPASFDALDRLLERQAWRLAHWRSAGAQINYRRFFDINGLAGLRVEHDEVFEAAHRRVLDWVGRGLVSGLRIDHPDGMADPAAYFERLQRRCAEAQGLPADASPSIYLVAEKILADDEPWRRSWPVHGDTGYRFANQALGLFVDASGAEAFDALTDAFVGSSVGFDAELDAAKRATMNVSLGADLKLLTELARSLALLDRHTRDLTRDDLRDAIVELAAAFDVYRSYVSERGAAPLDVACIEKCAARARARVRPSQAVHVDFLRTALLHDGDEPDERRALRLRFVLRFQQFTAPVMAKSMEDTAFYRHHRLVSLNDVGGDPRRFGFTPAALHAANLDRLRDMPHTLLGTSTHDSKRSEDVRARLNVLSEMPALWAAALDRWHGLAQTQWRIGEVPEPLTASDELLLYQTLVGVLPADFADDAALPPLRARVCAYMLKAVREAKQRSSWLEGDDAYEAALQRSIEVLLARIEPNPFLTDLRRFVAQIAPFGAANSLNLVALKLTAPGVPDVYQGCEDWAFALVDPDNRRPVDFDAIGRRLAAIDARLAEGAALPADLHKLFVTRALLRWRAEAAGLFEHGDYRPIEAQGALAEHVFAFARRAGDACSLSVVTRLPWRRCEGDAERLASAASWRDTAIALPDGPATGAAPHAWIDVLSGRRVDADGARLSLASLLAGGLPLAVLRPAT
ncbi:MAG TPA: malto-oligosyltrehalose synthase [Methylibium sp.]|uniref:malto-oligosyltrehalose synthase n=1 Tax=Methylibium sp. TaxID=2067992 RepID=UPI002DBAE670|nr:malto-oligosyltrehalose synthase [Methylibium sp.]HEU4460837.1 malto-oligosyltrehalose synthase [Methylibium sp.]